VIWHGLGLTRKTNDKYQKNKIKKAKDNDLVIEHKDNRSDEIQRSECAGAAENFTLLFVT
jgi:hypothetical protein